MAHESFFPEERLNHARPNDESCSRDQIDDAVERRVPGRDSVFLRTQSRAVIGPCGPAMVSSLLIPGFGAPLRRRHFCIRDGIAKLAGLACG